MTSVTAVRRPAQKRAVTGKQPPEPDQASGGLAVQPAAVRTGLSQHTLRDYERAGMLDTVGHQTSSRHRRYSDADVSRMSTLGLLFHAAEHTIRHGGQIITLAHVVQGAA